MTPATGSTAPPRPSRAGSRHRPRRVSTGRTGQEPRAEASARPDSGSCRAGLPPYDLPSWSTPRRTRASPRSRPSTASRSAGRGYGTSRGRSASTGPRPASRSTPSTLPRRPSADRCTSGTCSPTRTRTPSLATSGCAGSRSSTRWGGTTTGCRPSAGCRLTYGVRCDPSLHTTPTFTPPDEPGPKQSAADLTAQLRRAVRAMTDEDEKTLRVALASARAVGRLVEKYTTITRRRSPARSERSCATWRGARPIRPRRRRCGTSPTILRSRRPSSRPGSIRRHFHRIAFHAAVGTGVASRPPDPSWSRRAWPSSPTPTTSASRTCSAPQFARRRSVSRCPWWPTRSPTLTRAPASPWSAPSETRPTSVVARAAAARAAVVGRDGRLVARHSRRAGHRGVRAAYARMAGMTTFSAKEAMVGLLREAATWSANRADARNGRTSTRTATSRWRSSRTGSGTSATVVETRTSARHSSHVGRRCTGCPAFMRLRYESWVGGLNGDWLVSRQRFFGVPFPVWYR